MLRSTCSALNPPNHSSVKGELIWGGAFDIVSDGHNYFFPLRLLQLKMDRRGLTGIFKVVRQDLIHVLSVIPSQTGFKGKN